MSTSTRPREGAAAERPAPLLLDQTKEQAPGRVGWIDGARGLSIVAMIVSHLDYVVGPGIGWLHTYAMRPAAPMFLLLLGMLWRPGWRRRHWHLLGGAVASQLLAIALGFAFPNILLLMGAALLVMPWATRWPVATLAACMTQLMFWPVPDWWSGYAPGFVVGLAVLGACMAPDGLVRGYGRVGSRLGLEVVGRRPLTFYLGHLVALWVLAIGIRNT